MGLFDEGSATNLEQVLGNQANTKALGIQDKYAQAKRRLVGQQAASGRLRSGVSNYNLGDLATSEAKDIGSVYSDLASSLGQIPSEDWLNQNQYTRNLRLSELIGSLQKPSTLQEVLGGIRTAGNVAGTVAMFA